MNFKRPIPRSRGNVPTQFVSSALPGGGVVSRWTSNPSKPVIPSGHPSVVGQIVDKMRQGSCLAGTKPTVWTPPMTHDFVAKYMDNPDAFLKRCEDWYAQHPGAVPRDRVTAPLLNLEPVIAVYKKWARGEGGAKLPPISEREKAWRLAGYSDAKIHKALAYHKRMEETVDARQEALDLIFAKFPSANKPTPKTKAKKVIKVVKKKMPNSNNE
ncbi:hypothetical protein [Yellowstone lake phycodnavirus 2]|uniref:hypothetical protein n=1 Tax=Yellowstone lake phycodnavirus 2 TaxID=1586714 RepID=UPI0006EB5403|nr:hypothetical protein AR678_gp220 [Yellowstone lake phycodnavirus 2]BAT22494.1 hypothetical protein [Yellowstone lake phycodnavirus 2]